MKVKTKGKFSLPKKAKVAIIAGAAVIAGISALVIVNHFRDKANFYTKFDEFASIDTCNFRYVINVRSSEATGESLTAEELEDALNDSAFKNSEDVEGNKGYEYEDTVDGNYEAPDGDQTGNLYQDHIQTDWVTQDGSVAVDWEYPNYELVIEGRVESVEPLKASIQMHMTTDYTDAPFLNATVIDGKCYFDVLTLKDWLTGAGDASLVQLGKSIPEGVVYVVIDEQKELNFATGFAESDEVELSGASNLYGMYKRFVYLEKLCMGALHKGMGDAGLSNDDTRYRLSISGETSSKMIQNIKGMLNNAGGYYNEYVSNISKAGLADKKQVAQLMNEKDNFLYAIQPLWSAFNTLSSEDVTNIDATVVGKARDYSSSGVSYKEINLGTSFNWEGTEYIISIYGCKSGLNGNNGINVAVPKESVTEISRVSVDFGAMQEYLLAYFRFTPEYPKYQLNSNWDTFEEAKLRAFVDLVNAENAREETGIAKVNMYNIKSYIDNYADMTEVEYNANPATKFNYALVKRFLGDEYTATGKEENKEEDEPKVKGRDVTVTAGGFKLALTNADMPSNTVVTIDLKAELALEEVGDTVELQEFDLTKFHLEDEDGNRYPCNHKDFIRDANIGISSSEIKESIMVSTEEESAKLYFIVNGYADYRLCFDENNMGTVIDCE